MRELRLNCIHPMGEYVETIIYLASFLMISIAAKGVAGYFQKFHLPLITGMIITGIIAGPSVLKLIPENASEKLFFVNDFALSFIAFAAAGELYISELRNRFKSITWMTIGQLVFTFSLGSIAIIYLSDMIPFMKDMNKYDKIAVAILAGTIFVARSPASAIAIINELRAKGPFTQTAIGVTVIKDFLVILFFAINYSVAVALVTGVKFDFGFLLLLVAELSLAIISGLLLGKLLKACLSLRISTNIKMILVLIAGYFTYWCSHYIQNWSEVTFGIELYMEPLLICILGSFYVTNFSKHRKEFLKILEDAGPTVFLIFFTLTGASISLDLLIDVWDIALILFAVRIGAMMIGSLIGGSLGGDPWKFNVIGWMPYVTQAGVGLGLAMVVTNAFPEWGQEFSTIIIAVIILSQLIGPPLFKWSIHLVGEDHGRAAYEYDGERNAVIFGLEGQSFALARQLGDHGWKVIIASRKGIIDEGMLDVDIRPIRALTVDEMRNIGVDTAEAIVTLLSDKENYQICEICYEHFGTKDKVVRLNDRANFDRFHELGALIVEPTTAIVSLLDHLVRSPQAASLLLGMDENQDTVDLEVHNPNLHGLSLHDLRFPTDILILSITRGGQSMVTHGYTRLRLNDTITVVGSIESIANVELRVSRS